MSRPIDEAAEAENPMGVAPKPISNVVIIVSGGLISFAILGIITLMVLRPDEDNLVVITSIITMVGAGIAAFIGITNKQDIQIIHKAVNSQYSKWVRESNEAAGLAATLAAERVATAERQHIAEIVREESAKMAQTVKEETAAVAAKAAASALIQQSEQRAVIEQVAKQATEAALNTTPPSQSSTSIEATIDTVDAAMKAAEIVKKELGEK